MGTPEVGGWMQGGRAFSAQEIGEIRETVAWLPGLSRRELAATLCEHLQWHTIAGTAKLQACQTLLERLAAAGLLSCLPRAGSPTIAASVAWWCPASEPPATERWKAACARSSRCAWRSCAKPARWGFGTSMSSVSTRWATRACLATDCAISSRWGSSRWAVFCSAERRKPLRCANAGLAGRRRRACATCRGSSTTVAF